MVAAFLPQVADATVIEISLPGLLGGYQNTSHTVSVVLPAPPLVIHGASFRCAGTRVNGLMYCAGEPPEGQYPAPISLYAQLAADDFASVWYAEDPNYLSGSGEFTWTTAFRPVPPSATWAFFMDGMTNLTFFGVDPGTWCMIASSPSAIITEAVFIVDAEFPVAVERSTWGKVKALYR